MLPARDPFVDALLPTVVHMPFQRGFLPNVPSIYHPHDLQHVHWPQFFDEAHLAWRESWYGAMCRAASMVAGRVRLDPQGRRRAFRAAGGQRSESCRWHRRWW
jgi:hypothetical protein